MANHYVGSWNDLHYENQSLCVIENRCMIGVSTIRLWFLNIQINSHVFVGRLIDISYASYQIEHKIIFLIVYNTNTN